MGVAMPLLAEEDSRFPFEGGTQMASWVLGANSEFLCGFKR